MPGNTTSHQPAEAIQEIAPGTRTAPAASSAYGSSSTTTPTAMSYCLLDAPDEQAVRDHHAPPGVPCAGVNQVNSLL